MFVTEDLMLRIMDINSARATVRVVFHFVLCEVWANEDFRFGCGQDYYLHTTSCRQLHVVSFGNPLANKKFGHI